ncbi:glycoside hydrolase family 75 protein [Actinophytocola sp.]|uniref:glycoside hydrolase family 75 protein n=1 Tax=Actinophytocola sp. TaxID=1872138 RepID=UPI002ED1BC0F
MTIDCDGQRTEKCNPNTDPYCQNQTAWSQSDGAPLNAELLPYVVVPGITSTWSHSGSGITGATVAAVVYQGRVAYAVVGDVGPGDAIGEGSYPLAKALGINPDPRTGGVSGRVVDHILFPGCGRARSRTVRTPPQWGRPPPRTSWRAARAVPVCG